MKTVSLNTSKYQSKYNGKEDQDFIAGFVELKFCSFKMLVYSSTVYTYNCL